MNCPKISEIFTFADKFLWSVLDDGTVSIEKFTGDDESVVIPEEIDGKIVTKIGAGAFCKSISLKLIEIPDSVTEIGEHAFQGCSSLKSIKIPDSARLTALPLKMNSAADIRYFDKKFARYRNLYV